MTTLAARPIADWEDRRKSPPKLPQSGMMRMDQVLPAVEAMIRDRAAKAQETEQLHLSEVWQTSPATVLDSSTGSAGEDHVRRLLRPGMESAAPTKPTAKSIKIKLHVLQYDQPFARLDNKPRERAQAPTANAAADDGALPSDVQFVVSWYLAHPDHIQRAVDEAMAPTVGKPTLIIEAWEVVAAKLCPLSLSDRPTVTNLDYALPCDLADEREHRRRVVQEFDAKAA